MNFLQRKHVMLGASMLLIGSNVFADEKEDENETNVAERRDELTQMAEDTIEELRDSNESVQELYEEAYGYAVFDTTKGGLIVTGAGGTGVAEPVRGGEEVFMHMGGAGVGLGGGLENYKLVLFFDDEEDFEQFVDGKWDASLAAQAAAGEEGRTAEGFVNGAAAYRITDGGLMAQVDVTGMRFWPSARLNDIP